MTTAVAPTRYLSAEALPVTVLGCAAVAAGTGRLPNRSPERCRATARPRAGRGPIRPGSAARPVSAAPDRRPLPWFWSALQAPGGQEHTPSGLCPSDPVSARRTTARPIARTIGPPAAHVALAPRTLGPNRE
jgi:hypothetical protein